MSGTGGPADEPETGLPVFNTWGRVYGFVLGVFVIMVILLAIFTSHFARTGS